MVSQPGHTGAQGLSCDGTGDTTPALPSRWQQLPTSGIHGQGTYGVETPICPQGLWELPNVQPFPQSSFLGTLLIPECWCSLLHKRTFCASLGESMRT